ncbi:MAG: DNA mismatch repair protein MutS [Eubacteriales bacterium]
MALSPMMRQYLDVKEKYPNAILFFRLGDFYEMFYDDAKLVSRELDLTLTGKQCGDVERAPMCGIPYHSSDSYIAKLIDKGYSVVICEQMEDPATAKGLVKRDVVRVITPGTVTDMGQLAEGKNNYLASVYITPPKAALCLCDISTGDLRATLLEDYKASLQNELAVYSPKEVLTNADLSTDADLNGYLKNRLLATVKDNEADRYGPSGCRSLLMEHLHMEAERFRETPPEIVCAVGALIGYLAETQKTDLSYLKALSVYTCGQFMEMDQSTRRSLELCESMRSKEKRGTLLWVLDKTKTSMGARLLRSWIEQPQMNAGIIYRRQRAVEELVKEYLLRDGMTEALRSVLDLERLMTKVVYGTANAKDLRGISNTVAILPELKKLLGCCQSELLSGLFNALDPLEDLCSLIQNSIVEDPPFSVREGGFICSGVNAELDRLRDILTNSKRYLTEMEEKLRTESGLKNMKIGFNRVFGYYIEVSKTSLPDVPKDWIRKQTLTTGERFITEELKNLEATILGANDKTAAIEYELFTKIRDHLSENVRRIQNAADIIATADVLCSLANVAVKNGYTCPEVDIGFVTEIKDGRHPVVEQITGDTFVPNDTLLDVENNRLLIITGPNMAGKSTYMRQVALITVMAQIGSFVPASYARIGIVDKLFTRVGASDDLAAGQSTFMLEMTEVAYILKNATRRSLIIYDEVGRGTSTFDGMSIARAVAEYSAGKKLGARTLFATHYHELTDLAATHEGVVNYHIAAKKKGDGVVFLRKIISGAADDSYGIEVAALAGIPKEIIKRAKEVLAKLEEQAAAPKPQKKQEGPENLSIEDYISGEIRDRIRMLDVNTLTPIEALNLIWDLKKLIG